MTPAELASELPASVRARREVQPLLYAAGLLEGATRELGRKAYFTTVGQNVQLYAIAARVLDEAEARSLRMLPLKGALLGEALYGDPGLRPMADVDLIAHPADLDRVVAMMGELGFRRSYPERARFSPRHGHDVSFLDEGNRCVEVHYRLFHELAGDATVERMFEQAIAVEIYGRARPAPSWDDHLCAVAVHAATHAFGDSPLWIFDVALLADRAGGALGAVREAERRRVGAAFRAALAVARTALPSRIPALTSKRGDRTRARLLEIVLGREPLAAPPHRVRSLAARALVTDDPRNAVRELARKLELRLVELVEKLRGS